MNDFLDRFNNMVEELQSLSYIEVVEIKVEPPATKDALQAAEERIKATLAEPIRAFYSKANGLKLHWRIKPGLPEEEVQKLQDRSDDYEFEYPEEEENPFAVIQLLSIEDSFLRKKWKELEVDTSLEQVEFGGKTYPYKDFIKNLKPLDLFSGYDCMAYFLEEGIGNPKVLLLSDYYIEWDNSRITDFESYLEMLLVTRGIVQARNKIYSDYHGDTKPLFKTPASYWKDKHIPKLFRKEK